MNKTSKQERQANYPVAKQSLTWQWAAGSQNSNSSVAKYSKFLAWRRRKLNKELGKKYLQNNVFSVAEAAIKSHIIYRGLDRFISGDKLSTNLADNARALTPREMQVQLGDDWNPDIVGSNDGFITRVGTNQTAEQAIETTIHEYYHQLSENDTTDSSGNIVKRRGISINGRDNIMNEVLTQKYTLDTMTGSDYCSKCPYNAGVEYINRLYAIDGNSELFDIAYFQNDPMILKKHFDYYCGDGFYRELSSSIDAIVCGDPWDYNLSSDRIDEMIDRYEQARKNICIEELNT